MKWTWDDLAALQLAIGACELTATFTGPPRRTITYASLDYMRVVAAEAEARLQAAERIDSAVGSLGPHELAVLALIAERLAAGRAVYGELHPATDGRDFRREAAEELVDAAIYGAALALKGAG